MLNVPYTSTILCAVDICSPSLGRRTASDTICIMSRAERATATRERILDAVGALLREGAFYDSSMEALAERAGVTRVPLYRTFGSKRALIEGLAWHLMGQARLDRVDEAHTDPDARTAVGRVLRANCRMFAQLGESLPIALQLARHDADMRGIVEATYHGRRHRAMEALAGRLVKEGAAAPGWPRRRIADALLVLSSHEAFSTLVEHRGYSVDRAADLLTDLADGFLDAPDATARA